MTSPARPKKAPIAPESPDYKYKRIRVAETFLLLLLAGWVIVLYLPLTVGVAIRSVNKKFNIDGIVKPGHDVLLHFNLISAVDDDFSGLVFFHVPSLGGYQLCYTIGNFFATIACALLILALDLMVNIVHAAYTHREIITE